MAYPFYQNYQYNPMYYQQMQNMQQLNHGQQTNPQIQNGGFVMVKDITEAMNYPVAPGNSVTFKNENLPYKYTKTLGFSQLDNPIFEKFRLVKEVDEQPTEIIEENNIPEEPFVQYVTADEVDILKTQINDLKTQIEDLKIQMEESKGVVSA